MKHAEAIEEQVRVLLLREALNTSELLARSREVALVEMAVGHYLRFADQCARGI